LLGGVWLADGFRCGAGRWWQGSGAGGAAQQQAGGGAGQQQGDRDDHGGVHGRDVTVAEDVVGEPPDLDR